ncbi:UPF0058 family protein [Halomontanus rarus]|uniref:UPF0058 family protein n=1 Tax=Halomontanus rarus TaxID=3034020 RepID=UPI0023E77095|nr:UPF0058 family protein [Halovivax sp. TS33]
MRKQELVHTHALVVELRAHICSTHGETPTPDAFDDYDANDVTPAAVYHPKSAHKESVQLLLEGIVRTIEAQSQSSTAIETAQSSE